MTAERGALPVSRACELTGITSIVRVPENNPKTILRLLDAGVQGLPVNFVE